MIKWRVLRDFKTMLFLLVVSSGLFLLAAVYTRLSIEMAIAKRELSLVERKHDALLKKNKTFRDAIKRLENSGEASLFESKELITIETDLEEVDQ